MKKIWLVGLGAMLVTAMSANASLSFIWSNAVETSASSTQITWEDTKDGGPTFFSASLIGADDSFKFSLLPPPPDGGQGQFTFTSTGGFDPLTNTGDFLHFVASTSVPGAKVTNIAFGGVTNVSGPGTGNIDFPSASTLNFGLLNPGASGSTGLLDIGTVTFTAVPETNQLAIALGAAVIGATVLFRVRRSATA